MSELLLRSFGRTGENLPCSPAFKSRNFRDFAAKHSHVAMPATLKPAGANDVLHVHRLLFLLCHAAGNINPDGILINRVLKVLVVQIDCIPFELDA